jgi:hypothetical protein
MTSTTLLEARERFSSALDELRRKFLIEFDSWLKTALAADMRAGLADVDVRIGAARKKFAENFIDETAPPIIRLHNRDAELEILKLLRSYDARFEAVPSAPRRSLPADDWQPSVWRAATGGAFGAVIGVILLALQPMDDAPAPAPAITHAAPAVSGPAVSPSAAANQDPVAGHLNPQLPSPAGPPLPSPPSQNATAVALRLIAAAFAAALGAAVGVFLVACPPAYVLLQRAGLPRGAQSLVRKVGGLFLLLRGHTLITIGAVLLSTLVGVLALLLSGAKVLQILLGLMALLTILTARWTAPASHTPGSEDLRRNFVEQLDRDLRSDAEVWAALSAALVLGRDGPAPQSSAGLQ